MSEGHYLRIVIIDSKLFIIEIPTLVLITKMVILQSLFAIKIIFFSQFFIYKIQYSIAFILENEYSQLPMNIIENLEHKMFMIGKFWERTF